MTQQDIRQLREKLDMTQAEFADAVGVTQATVSQWENGIRRPDRQSTRLILLLSDSSQKKTSKGIATKK